MSNTVETKTLQPILSRPSMGADVIRSANNLQARQPQHARTLMRSTVKKPSKSATQIIKVQMPNPSSRVTAIVVQVKPSFRTLQIERLARAQSTTQSAAISRFRHPAPSTHSSFHQIAVKAQPVVQRIPVVTHAKHTTKPTTSDLLAQALQHANSHQQPSPKKPHRLSKKAAALTASFTAFLLVTGVLASSNMTSVRLSIASAKAGFAATAPSYNPSGYRLGTVSYTSGEVATNYLSNSDQRNYTLTEMPSNWDSETLRQQFVTANGQDYQTVQNGDQTIFLYGDGNATWVSNGIWYRIVSGGALSTRQLTDLAASLAR